jgi:hypothetical protein
METLAGFEIGERLHYPILTSNHLTEQNLFAFSGKVGILTLSTECEGAAEAGHLGKTSSLPGRSLQVKRMI